jgi:hypothetical protein
MFQQLLLPVTPARDLEAAVTAATGSQETATQEAGHEQLHPAQPTAAGTTPGTSEAAAASDDAGDEDEEQLDVPLAKRADLAAAAAAVAAAAATEDSPPGGCRVTTGNNAAMKRHQLGAELQKSQQQRRLSVAEQNQKLQQQVQFKQGWADKAEPDLLQAAEAGLIRGVKIARLKMGSAAAPAGAQQADRPQDCAVQQQNKPAAKTSHNAAAADDVRAVHAAGATALVQARLSQRAQVPKRRFECDQATAVASKKHKSGWAGTSHQARTDGDGRCKERSSCGHSSGSRGSSQRSRKKGDPPAVLVPKPATPAELVLPPTDAEARKDAAGGPFFVKELRGHRVRWVHLGDACLLFCNVSCAICTAAANDAITFSIAATTNPAPVSGTISGTSASARSLQTQLTNLQATFICVQPCQLP